jgi:hypothetical protein
MGQRKEPCLVPYRIECISVIETAHEVAGGSRGQAQS